MLSTIVQYKSQMTHVIHTEWSKVSNEMQVLFLLTSLFASFLHHSGHFHPPIVLDQKKEEKNPLIVVFLGYSH